MIYYYMNMYNCNVLPKVIQLNTNVISILKGAIMVEICIREQVFFSKLQFVYYYYTLEVCECWILLYRNATTIAIKIVHLMDNILFILEDIYFNSVSCRCHLRNLNR